MTDTRVPGVGALWAKAVFLHQRLPDSHLSFSISGDNNREDWYRACAKVADTLADDIPETYRSRTFSGIIGDIKALSPKQALSLYTRKKGLGSQYSAQYLRSGIDGGRGYQACASTALAAVIGGRSGDLFRGTVLDVGCAVGVTAGVLGLTRVTGFDLFPDLIRAARAVDGITGARHMYAVADMTRDWPFGMNFDTVVCGLVCHHLKTQADTARFFANANRVLRPGGSLIITLPAGSLATAAQLRSLVGGLESFGFFVDNRITGLTASDDDSRSLFWMFLIVAVKRMAPATATFIHDAFAFPLYRTPVTREMKGDRARRTASGERLVHHTRFRLIPATSLDTVTGGSRQPLVYERVASIVGGHTP